MTQTVRLGRIAGIRVGAHWSVLVIMVLLVQGLAVVVLPEAAPGRPAVTYWLLGVLGAALFLLSLLAHELAHAIVARRFGIDVEQVTLWLLGGVAEFRQEPPDARADLLTAAAGPLTSVAAGVAFGAAAGVTDVIGSPSVVVALLAWLAAINLILAVFNLLPGAPLDGGRVLRALLWWRRGDRVWAALTAARAGHALGIVLVFAGFAEVLFAGSLGGLWLALVGWFLVSAANAESTATRLHALLGRVPVTAAMHIDVPCGRPDQTVAAFAEVAAGSPYRSFPLCDADGRPAGLVRLVDLAAVPGPAREHTTLARTGLPLPAVPVLAASRTLADAAVEVSRGRTALVVDDGGRLIGMLTADDITHAAQVAALRPADPPPW